MGSKQTKVQLVEITDYLGFEGFCNDLMSRLGFTNINPLGGFKDKGRDAIHISRTDGSTTIFSYSVRIDWKNKLFEDLEKIRHHDHKCDEVYFVTNQKVSANDIDSITKKVRQTFGWKLEIFHLERISTLVDNSCADLKALHPNIFFLNIHIARDAQNKGVDFDVSAYANLMLDRHKEWQERYTPLLAEFREFEIYAAERAEQTNRRVPVLKIPELSPLVILLGESGAGKTTALWRLVVDFSKRLLKHEQSYIPIIVNLRNWSEDFQLRRLLQNEFKCVDASIGSVENRLESGDCLVCFDGFNELPSRYESKDYARRDLENFIHNYPLNRFVVTCRTVGYDPIFLGFHPDVTAPCFEIQRLDRRQIADYVTRHFKEDQSSASQLLRELDLGDDEIWEEKGALVNLARIPLHLYMIILEFKTTGQLPSNKAKMLRTFVANMVERDKSKQAARINIDIKELLLGDLAYKSLKADYYLSLPNNTAQAIIRESFQSLRECGEIPAEITFTELWREIQSNNFIVKSRDDKLQPDYYDQSTTVSWLHQMIFDYFLACKIIRKLVLSSDSDKQDMLDRMRVTYRKWDHPTQIALGLVPYEQGATLLEMFIDSCNYKLAQEAFKGQNADDAFGISKSVIEKAMKSDDWDEEFLSKIALNLPYVPFVNGLIDTFKRNTESDREKIASIVSKTVREHYNSEGAKRGEDILQTWIGNKNETVRFHAAQGYWARDKGQSSLVLKQLYQHGSAEIKRKVSELMEEWGIT